MVQVISIPHIYGQSEYHENGLKGSGKTFYVVRSPAYLDHSATELRASRPELIFCDYTWLSDFRQLTHKGESLDFLKETPIIAIFDGYGEIFGTDDENNTMNRLISRNKRYINIVYCMNLEEQFSPENFHRLIAAFDVAAKAAPVTKDTFQAALAELPPAPRDTALDRRRRLNPEGFEA